MAELKEKVMVGPVSLELWQGDITTVTADAIVTAANSGLRGGGGVDGAIHAAAGPTLLEECRKIGGCPTGGACVTGAGRLPARFVIHAVGPVWKGGMAREAQLLTSAYGQSLLRANELSLRSIAFPAISAGVYGYPLAQAAAVALGSVIDYLRANAHHTSLRQVLFVLFDSQTLAAFSNQLALMKGDGPTPPGSSPGN